MSVKHALSVSFITPVSHTSSPLHRDIKSVSEVLLLTGNPIGRTQNLKKLSQVAMEQGPEVSQHLSEAASLHSTLLKE